VIWAWDNALGLRNPRLTSLTPLVSLKPGVANHEAVYKSTGAKGSKKEKRAMKNSKKSGFDKMTDSLEDFLKTVSIAKKADEITEFLHQEEKNYPVRVTHFSGNNIKALLPFSIGSDAYGKPLYEQTFSSFAPFMKKKHKFKINVGDHVLVIGAFVTGIFSPKEVMQINSAYTTLGVKTPSGFFAKKTTIDDEAFEFIDAEDESESEDDDDAKSDDESEDGSDDEPDDEPEDEPYGAAATEDGEEADEIEEDLAAFCSQFFSGGGAAKGPKKPKAKVTSCDSDDSDDSSDSDEEVKKTSKKKDKKKLKKKSKGHKTSSGRCYKGGGG